VTRKNISLKICKKQKEKIFFWRIILLYIV